MLCVTASFSCDNESPALQSALEAKIQYFFNNEVTDSRTQLLQEIREATDTIDLALTRFTDTELANAVLDAHAAGAKVRVVGDFDYQTDEGFQLLENAGVEVVFGDGELRYLPDPTITQLLNTCGYNTANTIVHCPSLTQQSAISPLAGGEMIRPGEMNVMSHNFITIGQRVGWVFAHPQFGGVSSLPLAFRFDSEILKESFWREFNQMHGGVFSSNLDAYNGPIKSTTSWGSRYMTEFGEVWMRYSPQERVVKAVIDEVYRARGNVWIMTDTISEDFLIDALEYKKSSGFDVRIMVREDGQEPALLERLETLDVRFVDADFDYVPTIVLVDSNITRAGKSETQRAHIISHPLWKTGPFRVIVADPNDKVEVYYSDSFTDGMMWTLTAYPEQKNPVLDNIELGWETLWENARRSN